MDTVRPHRKILRSPSVKRKSKVLPINQRVQLQRVLGVTVSSNASLSCDSNNGTIAYPAGCVVVLFNPRRNKQTHIFNTSKKTITALAFSRDGKHLITGETGHQPAVRVWDVAETTQVAEFRGHKFGINCVAFSPNMKEIVSVGTQHDMMINVWNWKTGNKVASNKVSSKVSALAFSEDGKCFVTVGNRHVRFWYLEERRSKINQTVPLMGRSGILGDQKDNFFCDVVAGQGPTCGRFFVITQSGLLCEFNEKRQLDKWVELRTKSATCITAGQEYIFVGCAEGVVRVFKSTTLLYVCSLPKPHHLGVEVTTATNPSHMVSNREDAKYPDTKAIAIDDDHKKVTCIYNDRSIYIWDVHDIKRVGKAWSFLYHSSCIWSLEVYPQLEDGIKSTLPPGSFLTASGDDTIRVWNLNTHMPENTAYKRNIYSNELLKIVYVDPSLSSLCNVDYNPAGAADKTDTTYDGKNGVRSIRVSPDGAELASGDRQGNVRIYDMQYLTEKRCVEAHDSDVMCLEYSFTSHGKFLATSSRDRLIHVFDVDQNYGLVQTLGDHSSSITAVRFTDTDDKLRMISCGADKSILLRTATTVPEFQFQLEHHLATKITLYDMVIDPTQKCLATACQDRNVRLYNIQTTKEKKCYKGSSSDEGILLRIHLDPSGTYAATTCTDKNVCILDFNTGELMATMYGHSEVITGVKFANDLKHVITVSADGCIFVWRLPSDMTNHIKGRLIELGKEMKDTDYFRSDQPLMPNPILMETCSNDGTFPILKSSSMGNIQRFYQEEGGKPYGHEEDRTSDDGGFDDGASQASLDYRFSIGQLPNWAKAKFGDTHSEGSESSQEQLQPKGRWAQRADHNIEFKSQLDLMSEEDTLNPLSDARKSGAGLFSNIRRETVVLSSQPTTKGTPVIDDDKTFGHLTALPASARELRELESKHYNKMSQYKSDTALNLFGTGPRRSVDHFDYIRANSIELDDTDELDTGSDTTEVIYPPTDIENDIFESTYQVFAVDEKQQAIKSGHGNISNHDDISESTDPISLEEDEDHNDETLAVSAPTTPSDPDKEFLSTTPDKEDFVRENFEEDAFTPVPLEKFMKNVDKLERQALDGAIPLESIPFSPRLSLSARFMSRVLPKTTVPGQIPYRQDNWFNRNKMEMSRAMDETRKSLLAMNLRSDSCDSDSPDKEDSPSPPTKLEEEDNKLPPMGKENISYSSSPTSGNNMESRSKNNPREIKSKSPHLISSSTLKTNSIPSPSSTIQGPTGTNQGPSNTNQGPSSTILGPSARRISQEKEKRRSRMSFDQPTVPETNEMSVKSGARPRPAYFKPTQSSKNKTNKTNEPDATPVPTRPSDLGSRKPRQKSSLANSKLAMYASTPNLIQEAREEQVEEDIQPRQPRKTEFKFSSTSNLLMLSDFSRSVPDVNDLDSSTDSSSSGSAKFTRRSGPVQAKLLSAIRDKQLMPPPDTNVATSVVSSLPSSNFHQYKKFDFDLQPGRKISASELTLDQAKNILAGKSGVLAKASDGASLRSTTSGSLRLARESRTSSMSTVPTVMSDNATFDTELAHADPVQLAVAEEIEFTANMLRHQKQTGSHFSPDRLNSHPPSNLEASPLDLPERDQPSPSQRRVSPRPSSQTFQSTRRSNNQFMTLAKVKDLEHSGEEHAVSSIKDRIAKFQPAPVSKVRRTLPSSPSPSDQREEGHQEGHQQGHQSDTGLGSESLDTLSLDTATYNLEGNSQMNPKVNEPKCEKRLSLGPTSTQTEVTITQCQLVLNDFKKNVEKMEAIFSQIEGRTDEEANKMVAMFGEYIQDKLKVLAILASKTQMTSTTASLRTHQDTFHLAAELATAGPSNQEQTPVPENHMALLSATRDLLKPIWSQLSHELSHDIIKMVKAKVEDS